MKHARYILLLLLASLAGCNIETTPVDEEPAEQSSTVDLSDGFHLEPYGIGSEWYDYDSTTHAITPRPLVYRLSGDGVDVYFAIESYYDERGDSGYFTLHLRQGVDGPVQTLALGANVKDAPVCVDMFEPSEVDCQEGQHHLVFRADLRVVPPAGFAVQNPSIYTYSHFADDAPLTVSEARGTIEALPGEWTRLPDAKSDRNDQLLGDVTSGAFVQATADMMLAGWAVSLADDSRIELRAHCQPLAASADAQALPDMGEAMAADIVVDDGLTYVDLCGEEGPEVVDRTPVAPRGLWESSDGYDLIVERFDDQVSLRLPPGHLIRSVEASESDGLVDVPASLWE